MYIQTKANEENGKIMKIQILMVCKRILKLVTADKYKFYAHISSMCHSTKEKGNKLKK